MTDPTDPRYQLLDLAATLAGMDRSAELGALADLIVESYRLLPDLARGLPAKAHVRFRPDVDPSAPWEAYLPPTGPECYDGDPPDAPILGPWGESYWRSFEEACAFVARVYADLRHGTARS